MHQVAYRLLGKEDALPEKQLRGIIKNIFDALFTNGILSTYGLYQYGGNSYIYCELIENDNPIDMFELICNENELGLNLSGKNSDMYQEIISGLEPMEQVFYFGKNSELLHNPERVATFMRVKKGKEEVYKQEHKNVWEPILEGIDLAKIQNYSIFMLSQNLFSFFEVEDLKFAMNYLANDKENQKWQHHMAPLMDIGSGIEENKSVYMKELDFRN